MRLGSPEKDAAYWKTRASNAQALLRTLEDVLAEAAERGGLSRSDAARLSADTHNALEALKERDVRPIPSEAIKRLNKVGRLHFELEEYLRRCERDERPPTSADLRVLLEATE